MRVKVLPLWTIQSYENQISLFKFIRENLTSLQYSVLLDAIFEAFWEDQRKLIFKYSFLPFLIFFFVANFYYSQCLFASEIDAERSIWFQICRNFAVDEDVCQIQDSIEPIVWVLFLALTLQ